MQTSRDQNGNCIHRGVRLDADRLDGAIGWGVTVWFGGNRGGVATNARRYCYRTREQARAGDIGDPLGVRGRVA